MQLVSFQHDGVFHLGAVAPDGVVDLGPGVPGELAQALRSGVDVQAAARDALAGRGPRLALDALDLAPVVPRPSKVLCMGLNYFDHASEAGLEKPAYPMVFMRGASSLLAHGKPAIRPRVSDTLDFEAELAVVFGRPVRHATAANALDGVFGYSCFNDISVREYQRKTTQWTMGKNFDATGALGPCLVTADALPPGATGLRIRTRLNGATMQDASISDMMWSVADAIVLISECMTLEAGDVLVMGTPAGVGAARKPPVWMRHGDVVDLAKATRRVMRQNLAWSLVYNLTALPIAMAGLVTPWWAALGMSMSSLVVVLNATRLGRAGVATAWSDATAPATAAAAPAGTRRPPVRSRAIGDAAA